MENHGNQVSVPNLEERGSTWTVQADCVFADIKLCSLEYEIDRLLPAKKDVCRSDRQDAHVVGLQLATDYDRAALEVSAVK